jgi:GNAT superfamily N-acetyltransferase
MSSYEIRRATPGDAQGLADAHRDSIQSLGPASYPPQSVEDWQEAIGSDLYLNAMNAGEVFFIAVRNGLVLGFSSDYACEGTIHGTSVYVRGSAARQGIGSALLREAEAHAATSGATAIEIDASLVGLDFYRINGYIETGRGETCLRTGRAIACVFMRKRVAPLGAS